MNIPQIATVNAHYGIRLEWEHTGESDFSHYAVYMSTTSDRNYEHMGNITDPSFSILSVQSGTYYFVIYVHDTNGNTSPASDEIIYKVL